MDPNRFEPFSAQHGITLLVGIAIGAALITAARKGGGKYRFAAATLAFANLSAWPLSQFAWMGYSITWDHIIPFHLCDLAAFTAGFALLTGNRLLRKLTFFWGLAATLQALATPAVMIGFPHGPFIMFFVHHFAVVIAAVWIPVVDGWRPRIPLWHDPVQVYGCSVVYLMLAMGLNHILGTNFAFASAPPANPSLIDYLGPWPWYLLGMQAIAITFFLLLTLPFLWIFPRHEPAMNGRIIWKAHGIRGHVIKHFSMLLNRPTNIYDAGGQMRDRRWIGEHGEVIATRFLRATGHRIIKRNFRKKGGGEVDIIASRNGTLLFIEVKTRGVSTKIRPLEAVTKDKQRLIERGANAWLRKLRNRNIPWRFDVIEIWLEQGCPPTINHVRDAF